ncbi:MAG: glycosyl hydrolase [Nitrospirae bacterium]|nr:glycosyl hydrolase [Nitrospirota bacterium]
MSFTVQKLKKRLEEIKALGYVKTHRAHDTGVGKTLEDLLGIKENNIRLPDIGEVEIKAKRIDSNSMLTLATKAPKPRRVNRLIFEHYKYLDKEGSSNLHSTVYGSRYNSQGFRVRVKENKLFLENRPHNIEAYWDENIFSDVLFSKSNYILLVFAQTKGERKTINEHFHYTEAYLLRDMNADKFYASIANDFLKVDIRIGVYRSGKNKGKYHDHGTGFRMSKQNFLQLYDSYEKIL